MEKEYIQKLLDSYIAAETTKEEEQFLSDYFSTHRDIPAEWRNISVMFRSIRQYGQKPDASHRSTILTWSAAAVVIAFIFGTGWLLMRQEVTETPSDAIAQVSGTSTTEVVMPRQETITEETSVKAQPKARPVSPKRRARRKQHTITQSEMSEPVSPKRRARRKQHTITQSEMSEPVSDVSLPDPLTPSRLSAHRDEMRSNIRSTFENRNIFIAQNTTEL